MLTPGRQLAIGFGAIAIPTAMLYLLVLLWPPSPAKARFLHAAPSLCDELGEIVASTPSAGPGDDRWMQLAAARDRYCRD